MYLRFVGAVGAATIVLLAGGCSGSSSEFNAPPDPSLTYDMVVHDVAKYRGKRVRWIGQFAKGNVKDKALGKGSSLDAVFVDTNTDLRVELRAFAVEAESEKGNIDFMFEVQGKPVGDRNRCRNASREDDRWAAS